MYGKKCAKMYAQLYYPTLNNPYSPGLFDLEIDLSPVDAFLVAPDG